MAIVKAGIHDVKQCVDLLFIPEIGKLYFPKKELLLSELENSMDKDEIYVDKETNDEMIRGVIWYQHKGLFHTFPYLHMIAVRENSRHQGVGDRLLNYFEQDSLQRGKNKLRTKAFLLVNESNIVAQQFYLSKGYEEMSSFKNLFRKGVTEILLMKTVTPTKRQESKEQK